MAVTLTGLRCMVAIADAGLSVSAAAQRVHLTQPCVSRHLKQLEEALGFQVFARHGRQFVEITPSGQQALDVARRVVRDVEALRLLAADRRADPAGELSIAAPQTYALYLLPPHLQQLRARYPGLSVRIRSLGEGERVRAADHGQCDVVILSTARGVRPEGIAVPLFSWRRVVLVPPGHVLAEGHGPVPLRELARWPLVTYEASRETTSSLSRAFAAIDAVPDFACSTHDTDTLKAYTRAGLGVGLVAELSLTPVDFATFAVRPVEDSLPPCVAWAVLPPGRVLRNPTVELLHSLAPHLAVADLRRVAEGHGPVQWPEPPELSGRLVAGS